MINYKLIPGLSDSGDFIGGSVGESSSWQKYQGQLKLEKVETNMYFYILKKSFPTAIFLKSFFPQKVNILFFDFIR